MRRRALCAITTAIVLSALVGGCSTLSEADLYRAEHARLEAEEELRAFARAVAEDDVLTAMSLLAARVPARERARLERTVRKATWLELYTGYRLDATAAVNSKGARAWLADGLELSVPAANARGVRFEDEFTLAKTAHGWALVDFSLQEPVRGEEVDLPQEDKEKVREKVEWVFDRLKKDKPGDVWASLPKETNCRFRQVSQSLWRRIVGAAPRLRSIYSDLETMTRFDLLQWPDPDAYLPTAYVSAVEVLVFYDVPYLWPEGGITQEDNLRIEIFLRKRNEQWEYHLVRLYGRGIPESL